MNQEKESLNKIAVDSWYCKGVNRSSIEYSTKIFMRNMVEGSILELGPAEGIMTDILYKKSSDMSVVEGAEIFCDLLKKRYTDINVYNCLIEEFTTEKKYKNIILSRVLEHLEDPVNTLKCARNWLDKDGIIFAAVPNCRSLHRQAAVIMGMLHDERQLNEADKHHGHRRVYDPESLRSDFIKAGYKILQFGGYWMKPVSNRQIEESWDDNMINAFMQLGERYPDIAGEIYIIASI